MDPCNRCKGLIAEHDRILSEIAHAKTRFLSDILRRDELPALREKAHHHTQSRLEENQRKIAEYEQELAYLKEEDSSHPPRIVDDRAMEELERTIQKLKWQPQEITGRDLQESLQECVDLGYLYLEEGEIVISPKMLRIILCMSASLDSPISHQLGVRASWPRALAARYRVHRQR